MSQAIALAPVRKSVRVGAAPARAFEIFTSGFGAWWPRSHFIGKSPMKDAIIEPRAGGRWYEKGEDGSESTWGKVLVWEPPTRLVLAWQLNGQWSYDPALITEVEIRFIANGENATLVELEHRYLERMGDGASDARARIDSPRGWGGLLQLYAQAVEGKA
ncbi:MAG TPA: SRPBCC family protein [Steroidobacteraceae bacterium]